MGKGNANENKSNDPGWERSRPGFLSQPAEGDDLASFLLRSAERWSMPAASSRISAEASR